MSFTTDISHLRIMMAMRLAILCLFVLAYSESIWMLVVLWSGTETAAYSHGFLTFACTLYLIYLQKDYFINLEVSPNYWALLPLASLSLLWFAAKVVDVQTVQTAVLPAILLCTIAVSLGSKVFKLTLVPVSLLFLSLPLWTPLLPYLVRITTSVTHVALQLIGRPVFVEGNLIHLPGGSFVVEKSCAGLQFLLVTTILSLIFTSMQKLDLRKSALLLLIGTALALFANWVRVVIVVLIGDFTEMQSSLVDDHANLGWVIYLILVLIPFFFLSKFFVSSQPVAGGVGSSTQAEYSDIGKAAAVALYLLSCTALVVGPLLYSVFTYRLENSELRPLELPQIQPPWRLLGDQSASNLQDWRPAFQGQIENILQKYSDGNHTVELHVVYYARQQQGAELINTRNFIADDELWIEVPDTTSTVRVGSNIDWIDSILSVEVSSRSRGTKSIWYWYNVGGQTTSSQYMAKLLQFAGLLRNRADGALYALAIECDINCNNEATFESFLESFSMGSTSSL